MELAKKRAEEEMQRRTLWGLEGLCLYWQKKTQMSHNQMQMTDPIPSAFIGLFCDFVTWGRPSKVDDPLTSHCHKGS